MSTDATCAMALPSVRSDLSNDAVTFVVTGVRLALDNGAYTREAVQSSRRIPVGARDEQPYRRTQGWGERH